MRFRKQPIVFEVRPPSIEVDTDKLTEYSDLKKSFKDFSLEVEKGIVHHDEIITAFGPMVLQDHIRQDACWSYQT